jgi:hypothetical protein
MTDSIPSGSETDNLFHRLRALVQKFSGRRPDRLLLDADLRKDLGVDGDDAYQLLEAYMKEFSVDMTRFEFKDHFEGEGIRLRGLRWILGITKTYQPVTISRLVEAAKTGRW